MREAVIVSTARTPMVKPIVVHSITLLVRAWALMPLSMLLSVRA